MTLITQVTMTVKLPISSSLSAGCLLVVTDEEIGGHDGMELFVESDAFKQLNIAFALDEGAFGGKLLTLNIF